MGRVFDFETGEVIEDQRSSSLDSALRIAAGVTATGFGALAAKVGIEALDRSDYLHGTTATLGAAALVGTGLLIFWENKPGANS